SIEGAVEAVKLGAFDYVKKPVDLEELKLLADRARENRLLKQELSYYRRRATRDVGFATMVGESPAVRAVLERARQIAALEDGPPRRQRARAQGGRPHRRRHQPRSRARGEPRAIPPRSLFPPRRDRPRRAAVARAR